MQGYFKNVNDKLDQGWKMTDLDCPECKFSCMCDASQKRFYCCKCEIYVTPDGKKDESQQVQPITQKTETFQQMIQKTPSKKVDVSKIMGEKLLQGWCLMAEVCGSCNQALMRNKQKEKVCIQCTMAVENNSLQINATINQQPIEEESDSDFDEDFDVIPIHQNKTQEQYYKEMGEYLLSGWCMMAESCDTCLMPFMKKNSKTICVICDKQTSQTVNNKVVQIQQVAPTQQNVPQKQAVSKKQEVSKIQEISQEQEILKKQVVPKKVNQIIDRKRELSDQIGDYLLKGWTMLAVNCLKCNMPLMRLNEKTVCIQCQDDTNEIYEEQTQKIQISNKSTYFSNQDQKFNYKQDSELFFHNMNALLTKASGIYMHQMEQSNDVEKTYDLVSHRIANLIEVRQNLDKCYRKFSSKQK